MKFCILYDPDKPLLAERMFEETVKHKEMIKEVCDFWVGTTKGSSKAISFWLKKLEKEVEIVDWKLLEPFEKDHAVFVCKKS